MTVVRQPHHARVACVDQPGLLNRVPEDGGSDTARQVESLLGPVKARPHMRAGRRRSGFVDDA
ncbi:hypothetical protein [Streptomyces shenzhenensis]|uniref:hypothetical protein n=1 Tax=Streptomyces shenzhenensis TaxID=943815 RepID=UPI0015F0CF75|nr:hypothetical protein [Streptomyces shenzhenensis]